jgi:hypothetical protein
MLTADDQGGKSSKDSLMWLFEKPPQSEATTAATATTNTRTETTTATTIATAAGCCFPRVKKLSHKFNIPSPDKPKLAMELVSEMDTPQKVPLMIELVKG